MRQRNERVAHYRDLVRPIALHYSALCREAADDLIQVGLLGLIRAAELFRPDQGTPFSAFARHHIRGAILHYLRDQAPAIRLPRRQQELEVRLRHLQRNGRSSDGRPLEDRDLCRLLGLSPTQWQRFEQLRRIGRVLALEEGGKEIATPVPDDEDDQRQGQALELLSQLDPRQRTVLQEVVLGGHSLRHTARLMDLSPMTVHRLLARGLAQLRRQLDGEAGGLNPVPPPRRAPSAAPVC